MLREALSWIRLNCDYIQGGQLTFAGIKLLYHVPERLYYTKLAGPRAYPPLLGYPGVVAGTLRYLHCTALLLGLP